MMGIDWIEYTCWAWMIAFGIYYLFLRRDPEPPLTGKDFQMFRQLDKIELRTRVPEKSRYLRTRSKSWHLLRSR